MTALAAVVSIEDVVVRNAVAACRKALDRSADWFLDVWEAGSHLGQLQRQPGSSCGMTRYQATLKAINFTRDRANRWQRVGEQPREEAEAYVRRKRAAGQEPSIDEFIGKAKRRSASTTDARYRHELAVLAQHFGTRSQAETQREAVRRLYEQTHQQRCAR